MPMPENIYFKPRTTPQERDECFRWYEEHMDRLPKSIKVKGLNILNLPRFARRSIQSLKVHLNQSSVFEGQFSILRLVQETLRQDPNFED